MALSRRQVLLAFATAFIGWGYATHWVPGLRYLPHAFVAGILSCVVVLLWSVVAHPILNDRYQYAELSAGSTFLTFTSPRNWAYEHQTLKKRDHYVPTTLSTQASTLSIVVDGLLGLILKDFVRSWYGRISLGSSFPNAVDASLRAALRRLIGKFASQDLVLVGVTRLLPIWNSHTKRFNAAELKVRGKSLERDITDSEELDIAIAQKYGDGRLHVAAAMGSSRTTTQQQYHLRHVVDRILPEVMPKTMMTSPAVVTIIREIVACAVLFPVMQLLSDPDVLNQLVEVFGRSIIEERKSVLKLRAALDEAASPEVNRKMGNGITLLGPNDNERKFERFIKNIRQSDTLSDLRRARSDVQGQLRKYQSAGKESSTYIRRLEIGRKILDQRIQRFTADGTEENPTHSKTPTTKEREASLRQILYDAAGLSYFMEFMDRRRRTTLVQFWVVVDGFRSPLDDPLQEESRATWNSSDRQDLALVRETYLEKPELSADRTVRSQVDEFLKAGNEASRGQFIAAQHAIFKLQREVYQSMLNEDFPKFKNSDLYFKWAPTDSMQLDSERAHILWNDSSREVSTRQRPPRHSSLAPVSRVKEPILQRGPASSSDLIADARTAAETPQMRQSFDTNHPKRALFDDADEHDPLAQSTNSLMSETNESIHSRDEQSQAVDAVQAALEDIVETEPDKDTMFPHSPNLSDDAEGSRVFPGTQDEVSSQPMSSDRMRPSLTSLGLLGAPARRTVFSEGDLFGESEKLWEDENPVPESGEEENDEFSVREAAPGDLGLTELIQGLNMEIKKLEAQEAIVDNLTRKSELTNNVAELKILRKSKASLEREIQRKELQRQQYIVQESDNTLYGRATIAIKNIMVGTEDDGHEFALYVVEVQRQAGEKAPAVSWAVARRYSEFHELHRRLRSRFPTIKTLDFPRRQVVLTLQKDFLKKRRAALERYLQVLLTMPEICRSLDFRAFLSQQAIQPVHNEDERKVDKQDLITRIYNSVTDGMEEFLGNVPVLDQLSVAGQNIISAATSANTTVAPDPTVAIPPLLAKDPVTASEAEAEIQAFESERSSHTTSFIEPICDAFIETFQLKQGNNWLRGRALVAVIQQLLGGTIERKFRETFKTFISEDSLVEYLDLLRDTLWPDGKIKLNRPARTEAEKAKSRREASLILATLLPELAGGVVGRSNAAKAGRRLFATLNNGRLNIHLVYSLLDEIVETIFDGIKL